MHTRSRPDRGFTRRRILQWTALTGTALLFSPLSLARTAPWERHADIVELLDGAEPETSGISLDIPSVSENGSNIPLTVSVDSPMSDADHVESIHLFAPDNPNPRIASFHLTPLSGKARIATRIRLNESQRVFAIARLNDGSYRLAMQEARVTVSGCLTNADTYDSSDLMKTRVRIPETLGAGETGEVLTLINHPMETGLREDADGDVIPRRIIHSFSVELNGRTVMEADYNTSLSANPYLRFHIRPERSGTVVMTWEDDNGETSREEAELAVG